MAARRNISLPEDLDEAARAEGLNVSALAQQAIVDALDQRARMARLDAWLDELDARHGPPSGKAVAEAEAWVASGARVAKAGHLTAQALEEPAARVRAAVARTKKSGAAKADRVVVREAKTGTVKTNRTTERSAKTTSESTLSQGRTRRAKR